MNKELKKYLDKITDEVANSLQGAALAYFNIGIQLYEQKWNDSFGGSQIVLGNLSIACELLLKTIIARRMFGCLYANLSPEVLAVLHYPDSMPAETMPNVFVSDLRNFTEKSIDIGRAASLFHLLYPSKKQEFKSDLNLLARIRNIAVHAAFPKFQKYQLERVAYIACKLFKLAKDDKIFKGKFSISNESQINKIIALYDKNRIGKVDKAIEAARKQLKTIKLVLLLEPDFNKWEARIETCPVCENDALCYGYTDRVIDRDGHRLVFFKEQFKCENCKLNLDDFEELRCVDIKILEDVEYSFLEWLAYNEEHPIKGRQMIIKDV